MTTDATEPTPRKKRLSRKDRQNVSVYIDPVIARALAISRIKRGITLEAMVETVAVEWLDNEFPNWRTECAG